jgi:hypothetical protein
MTSVENNSKIAALNDDFRRSFPVPVFGLRNVPGKMVTTRGLSSLPPELRLTIWFAVAKFSDFTEDNDPHGEHDFGALSVEGVSEKIFWKIDYYADRSCQWGSEDPADPTRCFRVLTIMLASEY